MRSRGGRGSLGQVYLVPVDLRATPLFTVETTATGKQNIISMAWSLAMCVCVHRPRARTEDADSRADPLR